VWLYPIYFDFLPSFRLAKVLHLTKPNPINNPCSSNPCSPQQECQQILNQKSTYVCLCPLNEIGQQCGLIHDPCQNDGTCLSTPSPNRFICLCDEYHSGDQCQFDKQEVRLHIKNIPYLISLLLFNIFI
jgi:hypothetical protein